MARLGRIGFTQHAARAAVSPTEWTRTRMLVWDWVSTLSAMYGVVERWRCFRFRPAGGWRRRSAAVGHVANDVRRVSAPPPCGQAWGSRTFTASVGGDDVASILKQAVIGRILDLNFADLPSGGVRRSRPDVLVGADADPSLTQNRVEQRQVEAARQPPSGFPLRDHATQRVRRRR